MTKRSPNSEPKYISGAILIVALNKTPNNIPQWEHRIF
jgi:hypothetical protein